MTRRAGVTIRGTSNRNARGGAPQRRARRRRLEAEHAVAGVLTCYRCAVPLLADDVAQALGVPAAERFEVDRIVPGVRGGTYASGNVRPACGPCNRETGNEARGRRAA